MSVPDDRNRDDWHTLGVVAMVLVVAFAFQTAQLAEPVAAFLVIAALVAVVVLCIMLRFAPHVVRTRDGRALVYTRKVGDDAMRVLRTRGVYQSATYLDDRRFEPVFAYHRAFDRVLEVAPSQEGQRYVLALGGGGYAWPKHALTSFADVAVDVVEIDPAITRAARSWFFVDELAERVGAVEGFCKGASSGRGDEAAPIRDVVAPRLGLVAADARAVLDDAAAPCYDAIVNDVFSGSEPVRALATVEAIRAAKNHLVAGGVYAANVVSRSEGTDVSFLRDVVATLSQVFACVQVVSATDDELGGEDNFLVVASDSELKLKDAIPFDDEFLGDVLHDSDVA